MINRRQFLQASASLALVSTFPRGTSGATSLRTRPSWSTFRKSPQFPALLAAVGKMRANLDATKPGSWAYWTNVHIASCPHGKPYFLAWHRGFLARFEAQLRKASGDSALVLPYWNYYRHPLLPVEFSDPTSPLYRGNRTGSDVSGALSLTAFDDSLTHFQRGKPDAFEPAVETSPHGGVHNLIGGSMAHITIAPRDPIFWLHHANIDRLWDGWVYAGNGRHMPATSSSYWSGSFTYGTAVAAVKRVATTSPSNLGYRYDDRTLPSTLPASATPALPTAVQEAFAQPLPAQGASVGGVAGVALGPRSIRLRIPLTPDARNRVRSLLTRPDPGDAPADDRLRVVCDGVVVTTAGAPGGYFYKVLLNLPSQGMPQTEQTCLIGTLGPFEVGVALHAQGMRQGHMAMHGTARLVFPALDVLRRIWPDALDDLTVSFARVGTTPEGTAIEIDRVSVEAA